jgi:gamma-glutamyltranspeptidase/glutathione hydrolase
MNPRPLRLVLAPLAGAILALSTHAVAQEAAKKVNPYPQAFSYLDAQPTRARHGMVVTVHHLASDAGVAVLREGGNAIDAAVASAFALAVVHPIAGNLGGGGFILFREHTGRATFIDFREKAPLAATEDMYLDAHGNVIPDASVVGYRSIATPGSVAGLVCAEKKYGRLSLARVMAPAIRMAAEGFVLSHEEAHELSDPDLAAFAESKRIFQRNGDLYKEGEIFRQPELARTLDRIAHDPADFYHGKMAHELIEELTPGGSLLTLDDLAQYNVIEREPVSGSFHNYTVLSAPPPSSGGIVLLSTLNILEGYDLASLGDRSPASIHLIVEAFRRAYMDRAEYLGDPDFNHIPVAELTSKQYARAWRASINPGFATPSAALVRPAGFLPPAPTAAGNRRESNHTTHLSVVDKDGNAVSLTTTLNDNFGSRVTAGKLGILLNDEMDDFAVKMGVPNLYGLIQGPADAIAAGKRPLSAMTPTIVLEDGRLRFVLGSPGGSRIISTVTNIFLSAAEGKLNIQQAVDAPRFHHQYLPDKLALESGFAAGFPQATQDALRAQGYTLDFEEPHWSNGECIEVDPKTGELEGGQDQRSHYGKAAGY